MNKTLKVVAIALAFVAAVSTANAAFDANLTVGSTGTDVASLQSWLISKGYAIPAISSGVAQPGYFGSQTVTAVKAYQAANGIPSTGFFGPLTRAAVNKVGGAAVPVAMGCPVGYTCTANPGTTPATTGTPSTTALAGTDGSISDVNELSQYASEEVGDGQKDVKVLGFEVEASNDGDILLRSVKLSFDPAGNGSGDSDHLDDYIKSVSVWMGDKKIGSADANDFTEDSNDIFTKTITLSSGVIVRADDMEKFYVSVDAANNLDSGDIDSDSWTVDLENIRFEDGSGVVTTETGYEIDGMDVPIAFVTFSTSANTEVKFTTEQSSPDAGIIVIDDTDNTDDLVVLVGKLEVEGTSDVVVDELPFTLTTVGGANVAAVTGSVTLKIDGKTFTESVTTTGATTGTTTFDNLDLTLTAGKTYTFTVLADINDIDSGNLDEGDTLTVSLTASNRTMSDIENEEGDQLDTSSERSGTVVGEALEFRTNGIKLALDSTATGATTGTSANDDVGLFTIKYKVTAIGDTVYISSLSTTAGVTYSVDKSGTATSSNSISAALVNNTDTTLTSVGNYEIEEGQTETFTLSVSVPLGTGGTSGQYRTALTGVKWDTSDDTSMANTYSSELDSFKTAYAVLN
jgi:hypothetical protein